jgi:hypothetical protein
VKFFFAAASQRCRGRTDGDLERDEAAGFSAHARIISRYLLLRQLS